MAPFTAEANVLGVVRNTVREYGLLRSGDTVLVAVSGGMDSVVLLDVLSRLTEFNLRLIVAHLNHCLRGEDSAGDERFVADLAAVYGVPVVGEAIDVRELCRRERLSLEDGARKARYAFYGRAASRYGASVVALGHHADDQAETVLMRLLRGSGTAGLAAMNPRRGESYIRPLLQLRRAEIAAYFSATGLRCRTDASNADVTFLRNRIRHEVIPYLSHLNPSVVGRLTTTARLLAADEEILCAVTEDAFQRLSKRDDLNRLVLDLGGLRREKVGLRYRVYRRAISLLKGDLTRVAACHIQQIDQLALAGKPNALFFLPGRLAVVREYDRLTFSVDVPDLHFPGELVVAGPGDFSLPGGGVLRVASVAPSVALAGDGGRQRAIVDLAAAPFPWCVRGVRPGDRFRPSGMSGSKKVKDYFIDEKVPVALRSAIPLIFSEGKLILICGYRLSNDALVGVHTHAAVAVEVCGQPAKSP